MPTSTTNPAAARPGVLIDMPVGGELTLHIDGISDPVRVTIEHKSGRRARLRLVAPACVRLDRRNDGATASI